MALTRSPLRPLIALAFILSAYPTLAQHRGSSLPAEVHGQVRIAKGGTPAQNVLVSLESFSGSLIGQVMTDRTGKFRFSGLIPDQYTVTVHAPGFIDIQQSVDLKTNATDYVYLQIVPDKSSTTAPTTKLNTALIDAKVFDTKVPAAARKEFDLGREALLNSKEIKKSVSHLEKATSIYPDFLEAHLLLGTAYMDAQQLDKAEHALRRVLEIKPDTTSALFALGEAYRQQKRYAEAEKFLQEGLKLDAHSWQGRYMLGRIYFEKGEIAKAGQQVGRAIQLKTDFADAHLLAGNILLRARQPENAVAEFEEYLRLAPQGEFSQQSREIVQKLKRAMAEQKR